MSVLSRSAVVVALSMLVLVWIAGPAHAAVRPTGATGTVNTDCGIASSNECTIISHTALDTGILAAINLRVGHATASATSTSVEVKRFQREGDLFRWKVAATSGPIALDATNGGGDYLLTLPTPIAVNQGDWLGVSVSESSIPVNDTRLTEFAYMASGFSQSMYAISGNVQAGNGFQDYAAWSGSTVRVEYRIHVPPVLSITSTTLTAGGYSTSSTASFGFSADEAVTFECRLDEGLWGACTTAASSSGTYEVSGLGDGVHTIYVRGTNSLGQVGSASRRFTVDTIAPSTVITTPSPYVTGYDGVATVNFGGEDVSTPLGFMCKLDTGGYSACSSPYVTPGLQPGSHTLSVYAIDAATNQDPSPAVITFTVPVDTTPPETYIDSISAAFGGIAVVSFSASETSTFQCSVDGGTWQACTSPHGFSGLAPGVHTFAVRAIDARGNVDASPASAQATVPSSQFSSIGGRIGVIDDPADVRNGGGAGSDIQQVRVAITSDTLQVIVRFHGSVTSVPAFDIVARLRNSVGCAGPGELIYLHGGTAGHDTNSFGQTIFNWLGNLGTRTISSDGREVELTYRDTTIARVDARCIDLEVNDYGSTVYDDLGRPPAFDGLRLTGPVLGYRQYIAVIRPALNPVAILFRRSTPAKIAARPTHVLSMNAPGAGVSGMEWSVPAAVARKYGVKVPKRQARVTLGVGATKTTKAQKRVKVRLKLSKDGRKLLKQANKDKLKVRVTAGFLPAGSDTLASVSRQIALGR